MSARPPKQEQQRATEEVTEVAPDVRRVQLPISMPGLGHVNCYVLEDERGVAVVDPGLPGPAAYKTLVRGLARAGVPVRRVHTVIVTHSHPDHYGGAGRLRHESGADIITHRSFRMMWDPGEPPDLDIEDVADLADVDDVDDLDDVEELRDRFRPRMPWEAPAWGGTGMRIPWRRRVLMETARRFPGLVRLPRPTIRLDDAATIRLARREWVALHTPGHTEDHLCLFDPTEGTMLSGDHVLPTITPHIGGHVPHRDPLARFFASLDKVAAYGAQVEQVLPAHGHPFTDLAGRADAIRQHHVARLATLRSAIDAIGRPARVPELSQHLFSARAQGPMADSETFAHLEHLRLAGQAERIRLDDHYEYRPVG